MQIRNILVVVDKPKDKQIALARGLTLQKDFGAKLHLAAFTYHPMYDQRDVYETHQRRAVKESLVRSRTEWLREQVLDAHATFKDVVLQTVWAKNVAEWVAQHADPKQFDLVVKAARHTKTIIRTPTDWQLLRESRVPLLLTSKRRWPQKAVVLAALDLGRRDRAHEALNRRVLDAAVEIARAHDGAVHCVNAIEVSQVLADLDIINPRKVARKAREESSATARALLEGYGVPMSRLHMPIGKVGPAVNGVAKKLKANVLVMGTTARTGVKGLVVGNSAERVLTRAACDILAVKP